LCAPMTWRVMLAGAKGRGQRKCSPWSPRLGVGGGANVPTRKKCTCTKPPETYAEGPWRRLRPAQGCSTSEENMCTYTQHV
jgi:hypothetical protein